MKMHSPISLRNKMLPILVLTGLMLTAFKIPFSQAQGTVNWFAEDTITKGDWYFNPVGSPMGVYGSYAHILPNAPQNETQIPIGNYTIPIGNIWDPPYNWTSSQINGIPFYRADPPYWDEYVTNMPPVTYYVNGTLFMLPTGGSIQYPVFEWAYEDWHDTQTDPREVYYTTYIPGTENEDGSGGGPGWRFAMWDDGNERSQPLNGYMNFTLTFPEGRYMLSLYAYDYERNSRSSQEYRIYDETGTTLLASKQISGAVFDEGVYENFMVDAPPGGFTIILQVYNDAGHGYQFEPGKTWNLALSGIFVDVEPTVGGTIVPIDAVEQIAPWIGLCSIIGIISAARRYKHKKFK